MLSLNLPNVLLYYYQAALGFALVKNFMAAHSHYGHQPRQGQSMAGFGRWELQCWQEQGCFEERLIISMPERVSGWVRSEAWFMCHWYLIWHFIVIMNYSFMEAPGDSFEICKHMLTLDLASLLVSYTIFLINKQNSRTFLWKLILVIEAENAFWLPLSFFKEIQNVSLWFWLSWARLWHFRLFICEVTKALIAPQAAKKKGAETASIWKLQRGT